MHTRLRIGFGVTPELNSFGLEHRSTRAAVTHQNDLAHDTESDFFRRFSTNVQAGWGTHVCLSQSAFIYSGSRQIIEHQLSPRSARHQRDVGGAAFNRFLYRQVVGLMLSRDDNICIRPDVDFAGIKPGAHNTAARRKGFGRGAGISDCHRKAGYLTEKSKRFSDSAMAGNDQLRRWQDWIDINLHHSSAWHSNSKNFVSQVDGHDSGPAISDALHCLLANYIFDATAAHPPQYHSGGCINKRLGTRFGRTRAFDLDYGGNR